MEGIASLKWSWAGRIARRRDGWSLDQNHHKLETKTPRGRPTERWKNGIKQLTISGNESFEMEGNWEGPHPAVDTNRLKNKKIVNEFCMKSLFHIFAWH